MEFMCQVTGEPTPDLTWFHNDTPLELTGRYSVVERDGYQVLQVTDVTPADAGEYKVAATNVIGEAVCMATMEVQGLTSAYFVISHYCIYVLLARSDELLFGGNFAIVINAVSNLFFIKLNC